MKLVLTSALSLGLIVTPAFAAETDEAVERDLEAANEDVEEAAEETGDAAERASSAAERATERTMSFMNRSGMSVSGGIGVSDFPDDQAADLTATGASYTVRVHAGTRERLGFEAGYLGGIQDIDALGLDSEAILVANGLEGLARLNFATDELQPYVVGGIGWRNLQLANENFNTSSVLESDNLFEIPVGAGLSYYFDNGLLLDGRVAYRLATGEDMLGVDDGPGLDSWDVGVKAGWEF